MQIDNRTDLKLPSITAFDAASALVGLVTERKAIIHTARHGVFIH